MSYIPKNVLSVSLFLLGLAGFSGCASMDADVASLERQLAAKEERIEELKMSKADMQRVIDLKHADLERYQKASMQASHVKAGSNMMAFPERCEARLTSREVRQLQSALKQDHYYHGVIDGIHGPQTRRAIKSYQRANGLPIGGLTLETLQSLGLNMHDRTVVAGGSPH